MKILLDTHILLWASNNSKRLSSHARSLINDTANDIVFSVVSIWEVAIKHGLGRANFRFDPRVLRRALLDHNFRELEVRGNHALEVMSLPPLHKDPFDRILIAQALCEGFILLTKDPLVAQYPGPIRHA